MLYCTIHTRKIDNRNYPWISAMEIQLHNVKIYNSLLVASMKVKRQYFHP